MFGTEISNLHREGMGHDFYDADVPTNVLEFEHLRSWQRRRQIERNTSNQAMTPAINHWRFAVDELGILTREITARD